MILFLLSCFAAPLVVRCYDDAGALTFQSTCPEDHVRMERGFGNVSVACVNLTSTRFRVEAASCTALPEDVDG